MKTDHVPVRVNMINAQILHVTGETFIEPEIIPPVYCDQVAEPLRRTISKQFPF